MLKDCHIRLRPLWHSRHFDLETLTILCIDFCPSKNFRCCLHLALDVKIQDQDQ